MRVNTEVSSLTRENVNKIDLVGGCIHIHSFYWYLLFSTHFVWILQVGQLFCFGYSPHSAWANYSHALRFIKFSILLLCLFVWMSMFLMTLGWYAVRHRSLTWFNILNWLWRRQDCSFCWFKFYSQWIVVSKRTACGSWVYVFFSICLVPFWKRNYESWVALAFL